MASDDTDNGLGKPWTVVATFSEYGPARSKAEQLRAAGDLQVKVKQLSSGYTVRTRKASAASTETPSSQSKSRVKAKDRRAKESETEE